MEVKTRINEEILKRLVKLQSDMDYLKDHLEIRSETEVWDKLSDEALKNFEKSI